MPCWPAMSWTMSSMSSSEGSCAWYLVRCARPVVPPSAAESPPPAALLPLLLERALPLATASTALEVSGGSSGMIRLPLFLPPPGLIGKSGGGGIAALSRSARRSLSLIAFIFCCSRIVASLSLSRMAARSSLCLRFFIQGGTVASSGCRLMLSMFAFSNSSRLRLAMGVSRISCSLKRRVCWDMRTTSAILLAEHWKPWK
mmetsp:Transcript_32431/g.75357  ORF Transcript_32431/g.75357 Transcript_32431/m.75357 type:complete len:201 (+) Transcript_32431:692-1294(+)